MNIIEFNNMPRLTVDQKATVGIASLTMSEDGKCCQVWDGYSWIGLWWDIQDDGSLTAQTGMTAAEFDAELSDIK